MEKIIYRYKSIISVFITIVQTVVFGIYLSLIASYINNGGTVQEAIFKVPYAFGFISFLVLCISIQIYSEYSSTKSINTKNKRLTDEILQSACETFIYPHKHYHIRAMITMCDYKRNIRKVIYSYNVKASPERDAEYDIDFGVTGEALRKKIPIAQELEDDHITKYDQRHQLVVEPRLKSILAAPIFSIYEREKVIGVLAFDSMEPLERIRFNTDSSKELAQAWADIIAVIIDE